MFRSSWSDSQPGAVIQYGRDFPPGHTATIGAINSRCISVKSHGYDGEEARKSLWGSKSRLTLLDLVICVFSSRGMIVRCGVAPALPDLPPPPESVDDAGPLDGI